ncbi:MAG: hypothetical protein K6G88_15350 [Lachnospiraceae bacterium]|nr:hypothetical protein [Lachnospiraceae bacterium]
MKKYRKIIFVICFIIFAVAMTPNAFAWFYSSLQTQPDITAYIHKSYFESGDGTSSAQFIDGTHGTDDSGCAFEIKYPVQLYYFAWLQALGYFNIPNDGENTINQVYFYLSSDLDMTGYVLPEIGTEEYPFVGNFDGNGHTISNLTVQNVTTTSDSSTTLTDIPDEIANSEIVGFFGVVGSLYTSGANSGTVNGAVDSDGSFVATAGYTYSSLVNEIKNFTIDNVTIKTETDNALIGAIAGYVNGNVSNSACSDIMLKIKDHTSTIGITSAISDYSLVGYCTDAYKFNLNVSKNTVYAPEETDNMIYKIIQGEGAGFGGSVNMQNFYNRMRSAYNAASWPTYVSTKNYIVDVDGVRTFQSQSSSSDSYHKAVDYGSGGNYSFVKYQSGQETTNFFYVYGGLEYDSTIVTTTYYYDNETAYFIKSNGKYLNLDSNHNIVAGDTGVTKWLVDNSGYYYSVEYNDSTSQNYYYLNANGNTDVHIQSSGSTVWNNSNSQLYLTSGGVNYYLYFDGSNWRLVSNIMRISDGNGNYLGVSNGDIANVNENASVFWKYESDCWSCETDGNTYYLRNNGGNLEVTTNVLQATQWNYSGGTISDGNYYLRYNNGMWSLETLTITQYYVTDGKGNYLRYNSGLTYSNNKSNATVWNFSNHSGTGTIGNGTRNLRYYYNTLTTGTGTGTSYNWTTTSDSIYYTSGGNNYYINYSNGWKATVGQQGRTISYNGQYLNIISTTAVGTSEGIGDYNDENGNTLWMINGNTVYTYVGGTVYYMVRNGTTGIRVQTTSTTWSSVGSDQIYYRSGGRYYYVSYNNGWALSQTSQYLSMSNLVELYPKVYTEPYIDLSQHSDVVFDFDSPVVSFANTTEQIMKSRVTNDTEKTYGHSNATFFPINCVGSETFNESYPTITNANKNLLEPSDNNTGYVVSGNSIGNQTSYGYDGTGDIRISTYAMSSISASTNQSSSFTYSNSYDSRLEIITAVNNGTYSGFYRVSDTYNANNSNINATMSSAVANSRKVDYNTLGLKRYKDARAALSDTFMNESNIFGLHFMEATIDKNNYIVIPEANINGEIYENYKVPKDSIDFNVKRRGFITVFAGTYFNNNRAFFSLHEITRYKEDDPEVISGTYEVNDIKDIKEISNIYKAAVGSDYIYQYSDGTFSSNAARGNLAFNMGWMTDTESYSTWVQNAVYYFEIPVNAGEFALGSVPDKRGAYLFYLDIAANAGTAEDKERRTFTEKFMDETFSMQLPKGVQLVESGNSYNASKPYEFLTVNIGSGFSGQYPLVRTGDVFTYTDNANTELTYIGGALTAQTVSGNVANDYVYYPNGYKFKYIEHVTDKGIDTDNYDHFLVETTDTYDSTGNRTGRSVSLYSSILNGTDFTDNEVIDEDDLDHIITFTYNPTGHDNIAMRCVRAASEGGFTIAFNENITLLTTSITSDNPDVHVNFGDTTGDLTTVTAANNLNGVTIPAINLDGTAGGDDNDEGLYHKSVYGPALAQYQTYYTGTGANATLDTDTSFTMANLAAGNSNQNRTLTYNITLTPGASAGTVTVYARRLINSYSYTTHTFNTVEGEEAVASGTINVTVGGVNINSTAIGTQTTTVTIQ